MPASPSSRPVADSGIDAAALRAWVGRSQIQHDVISPAPLRALAATLDADEPDALPDELPPLWHWLYFLPAPRARDIGPDGHARRGGFLPPVPLPRRMWAGGEIERLAPLRPGDAVTRRSTVEDVVLKTGRSGALCFVTVRHEITGPSGLALRERHDIVYRPLPSAGDAPPRHQPAPADAQWTQRVEPDDVLLFRYSALTFNGHRIHYDRRYATAVEGYPGLVVHGPLMATLLAGLGAKVMAPRTWRHFSFRALKPVFDGQPLDYCAAPQASPASDATALRLWVRDAAGDLAMQAGMRFGSAQPAGCAMPAD